MFDSRRKAPFSSPETARTAGRCDRRGMRTTPRLCPAFSPQRSKSLDFSLFDVLGEVALSIWCWLRACHFLQSSRTAAQRPVFGLPAGTRSAASRKRHKLPTRARQAVTGVLSALSTCVFNKIGIFSPCRVLGKLLHLPVVVLLERELNWSDCE